MINYLYYLFLDYNVQFIAICVLLFFILRFKFEYFPSKARSYEITNAVFELNVRRKYSWNTSKYLMNLKIRTQL